MSDDTNTAVFNSMKSLPNKLLQDDGSITDITGKAVVASSLAYASKKALPNKFLNPDGTYSTLDEIFADIVDSDLFIIVDELPAEGDPKKIYLLPDGEGGFIEYHYVNGKWDVVGGINIDLSNYPTKKDMQDAINAALTEAKQYTDTQVTGALNNSY